MEMNQYLEVFIDESKENLQNVNDQLLLLEKNPEDLSIVNEIFRSAHTLKGMSATMGFEDLASLTHQMENVLDGIRNGKIPVSAEVLDVVLDSVEDLEAMINSIATGGDGKRDVSEIVERLKGIESGGATPAKKAGSTATAGGQQVKTVGGNDLLDQFEISIIQQSKEQGFTPLKLSIKLRDDCLLKAARVYMIFGALESLGEVIKANPSVELLEEEKFDSHFTVVFVTKEPLDVIKTQVSNVSEVELVDVDEISLEASAPQEEEEEVKMEEAPVEQAPVVPTSKPAEAAKDDKAPDQKAAASAAPKTIRVNIERLDVLMNLFEELVIDRGRLEQISSELNNPELHETVERMSRISGDLQNIILNMRMVPVETVFNRFPRMVRQLTRDLGKKIKLEIIGAETELDRTVIDEIGDPLVHLIRNALDHGVEMPDVRKKNGKPEEGTVTLKAYHSGNHVFIEIEDDGGGINREKVLNKAISKGIVSPQLATQLTDKQVFELIFASGFSTADKLSDISGRGVGLDVVKNTIESLGGSVTIDSKLGYGSIFSIQLPLTLSIISVMLVEIQQEKYAVPLSSIIETAIVRKEDILNAHNQRVIDFRGKVVPLLFLKDVFEVPEYKADDDFFSVVIVRKGDKMAGLVVDSFIGQQEVVLKALGNYLTNVFAISGATILGDGQVALIIDCNALIK